MFISYNCPECKKELFEVELTDEGSEMRNNKGFLINQTNYYGSFGDDGASASLEGRCIRCQTSIEIDMSGGGHGHPSISINNVSLGGIIKEAVLKETDTFSTQWKGVLIEDTKGNYYNSLIGKRTIMVDEEENNVTYSLIDDTGVFVENEKEHYEAIISRHVYKNFQNYIFSDMTVDEMDLSKASTFEKSFIINGIQMNDIICMVEKASKNSFYHGQEYFYFKGDKKAMSFEDFASKIKEFIETLKEGENQYECPEPISSNV